MVWGSLPILWLAVPVVAWAQGEAPTGYDAGPMRVLQVDRVEGSVSVLRGGKSLAVQNGSLIFKDESLHLTPSARLSLRLARNGQLDVVPESGAMSLGVEKLPFSSWAVDLDTVLRMDRGALRVRWQRPDPQDAWPLAVRVGRWQAQLGEGEFLFRDREIGVELCNLSGSINVRYETADWSRDLPPGQCAALGDDGKPATYAYFRVNWASVAFPEGPMAVVATSAPEPAAAGPSTSTTAAPIADAGRLVTSVGAPSPDRAPESSTAKSNLSVAATAPASATPPVSLAAPESTSGAPRTAPDLDTSVATAARVSTPAAAPPAAAVGAAGAPAASAPAGAPPASPADGKTPEATPDPPPPTGPEWIINVTTVADPQDAERHLRRLAAAGYPALLRAEQVRGRASYRVIIPGIGSDRAAVQLVESLGNTMGYTAAWALQKR